MSIQIYLWLLFYSVGASAYIGVQSPIVVTQKSAQIKSKADIPPPIVNIDFKENAQQQHIPNINIVNAKQTHTLQPNVSQPPDKNDIKVSETETDSPQIESGAVIRGILVFVGISMIFIVYLGFKTYRKKKGNVIVRKYGVRTRRSDVEMRPLPLDEDEEDETVFDVGNLNK